MKLPLAGMKLPLAGAGKALSRLNAAWTDRPLPLRESPRAASSRFDSTGRRPPLRVFPEQFAGSHGMGAGRHRMSLAGRA